MKAHQRTTYDQDNRNTTNRLLDPRTVRIESKVAVSLKTAKRMAVMLGNLIRRYEAANGTIDISAPQPANEERIKIQ